MITGLMGLILIISSTAFGSGTANLILFNGKVITVDVSDKICQAVAVQGDKILATGSDSEILALASTFCKKNDFQEKTITPGLIDSHYHLMYYGAQMSYPYHTQKELNRIVQILHNTGLQVAVHVGGDEGIDMTLTAFEQAQQNNPHPAPIEHGLFPTTNALQRMQASQIILSTQPQWITWYGDGYTGTTDNATMNRFLPLKIMLQMGIPLAFGCDVPASPYQEPKWAFRGAVLRRTVAGTRLTQTERLTIQEALRIHTMGSAYADPPNGAHRHPFERRQRARNRRVQHLWSRVAG